MLHAGWFQNDKLEMKKIFTICLLMLSLTAHSQELSLTDPASGVRLSVLNQKYPVLKVLLPGQPITDRGIEVEFPEHVTGLNENTNMVEHLYLESRGQ